MISIHPNILASIICTLGLVSCQLHEIGANLALHPPRKRITATPPAGCHEITIHGGGIPIRGWQGNAAGARHGTIIYLHGIADNRESGSGVMERFRKRGFDVIACDSRAHGETGGDVCTYGVREKDDLKRIMAMAKPGPVILIGSSLGAAVALQHAARDENIAGIVAAECFSDLRTVALERAPFFFSDETKQEALEMVEANGGFRVDDASPEEAARTIKIPILLVHGEMDRDTKPVHSHRIFEALAGPKELILVPGATHNQSLSGGDIWIRIERWVDAVISSQRSGASWTEKPQQ